MEAPEKIFISEVVAETVHYRGRAQGGISAFGRRGHYEYIRADLVADLVAEGNRMEAETDELKARIAVKGTKILEMRELLQEWLDEPTEWTDKRIGYEVRQISKALIEETRAALDDKEVKQ